MAPFPAPTLTVLAVLITSVESPFPFWPTVGLSVVCVVMVGYAVVFGEFRRNRR